MLTFLYLGESTFQGLDQTENLHRDQIGALLACRVYIQHSQQEVVQLFQLADLGLDRLLPTWLGSQ